MTDTPDEPPEWITGPGVDYDPPPVDDLIDPETRTRTHRHGRALVLQVLADLGIRKRDGKWLPREESSPPTPRA